MNITVANYPVSTCVQAGPAYRHASSNLAAMFYATATRYVYRSRVGLGHMPRLEAKETGGDRKKCQGSTLIDNGNKKIVTELGRYQILYLQMDIAQLR